MFIVGVDVETTGLEDDDQIIEMGVVLMCVKTMTTLASFDKIYATDKWDDQAAECHQIDKELASSMPHIDKDSIDPWDVIQGDLATYVVAHNAEHDYKYVTRRWPSFDQKPWLCTQKDIPHKDLLKSVTSMRLGHLAIDYGILITEWHRAIIDAEVCAKIAARHNLDKAYEYKMEPKYKLIAQGGRFKNQKDQLNNAPSVKDGIGRNYYWDGDKKYWYKENLTLDYVEQDGLYIKQITKGVKPKWSFEIEKMDPPKY